VKNNFPIAVFSTDKLLRRKLPGSAQLLFLHSEFERGHSGAIKPATSKIKN
jgi:hypothetical protein